MTSPTWSPAQKLSLDRSATPPGPSSRTPLPQDLLLFQLLNFRFPTRAIHNHHLFLLPTLSPAFVISFTSKYAAQLEVGFTSTRTSASSSQTASRITRSNCRMRFVYQSRATHPTNLTLTLLFLPHSTWRPSGQQTNRLGEGAMATELAPEAMDIERALVLRMVCKVQSSLHVGSVIQNLRTLPYLRYPQSRIASRRQRNACLHLARCQSQSEWILMINQKDHPSPTDNLRLTTHQLAPYLECSRLSARPQFDLEEN